VAASAVALSLGISEHELRTGLAGFSGVARRFDVQYRGRQAIYIDDYAHHPEELRAAITSARELFAGGESPDLSTPSLLPYPRFCT
jgi:UDP-N-acetylmuramate--alanine ligase